MYLAVSGTCYWCMEAVFRAVRGVSSVEQGFVRSAEGGFVEAALMKVDEREIALEDVIRIHLATHASSINHSAREKYPSAVYPLANAQLESCQSAIAAFSANEKPVVTRALPFVAFYPNPHAQQNYFWRQPEKPFCQRTILPKLQLLAKAFPHLISAEAAAFLHQQTADKPT